MTFSMVIYRVTDLKRHQADYYLEVAFKCVGCQANCYVSSLDPVRKWFAVYAYCPPLPILPLPTLFLFHCTR